MDNSEVLEQSLADLESQVERHRRLLRAVVEGHPAMAEAECGWADCKHRRKLCAVLVEAIAAMDESRKAFKSRQLENLRKDFARILQDELKSA